MALAFSHQNPVILHLDPPALQGRGWRTAQYIAFRIEMAIMTGAVKLLLLRNPDDCAGQVGADQRKGPEASVLSLNQDSRRSSILKSGISSRGNFA